MIKKKTCCVERQTRTHVAQHGDILQGGRVLRRKARGVETATATLLPRVDGQSGLEEGGGEDEGAGTPRVSAAGQEIGVALARRTLGERRRQRNRGRGRDSTTDQPATAEGPGRHIRTRPGQTPPGLAVRIMLTLSTVRGSIDKFLFFL